MLGPYYQEDAEKIWFSREQGSSFAKNLANDFNPLHNADAKRFCVPGDLLFSLVLEKYGISQKMNFSFLKLVTEQVNLALPEASNKLVITDGEKPYLSVERSGEMTKNPSLVENIIRSYVAFSGTTFPHVIVPLMAEKNAMINPNRPMVMYQSMVLNLENLDAQSPRIEPTESLFECEGKRGLITLAFDFIENEKVVGRGEKHMLVSGIKEYSESAMHDLISVYGGLRNNFDQTEAPVLAETCE